MLFVSKSALVKAFKNSILRTLLVLYNIGLIAYAITLIVYLARLVFSKCECSENWKRLALLYPILVAVISLVAFIIVFILTISGVKMPGLKKMAANNKKLRNNIKSTLNKANKK